MDIRKWDGTAVTEVGIYSGVPMDIYHGAVTVGPGISSSGLRTIESDSLAHYWDTSYLNPGREPPDDAPFLALGRALHDLTAGEGRFLDRYAVRPEKWLSWRSDDSKKWRALRELEGMTVITPEEIEALRAIVLQLARHPTIEAGILNGIVEHSGFCRDPVTGVWLKIRPDVIPTDSNIIVDLKSCSSAHPRTVRRSIDEFNYHMQMALALDVLLMTTGREMTDCVLVFVETKRPYCVNIKPLFMDDVELGRRQNRRAIDLFAKALETGEWPGYADDEVPCGISEAYRKRLLDDEKLGALPTL